MKQTQSEQVSPRPKSNAVLFLTCFASIMQATMLGHDLDTESNMLMCFFTDYFQPIYNKTFILTINFKGTEYNLFKTVVLSRSIINDGCLRYRTT